MGGADYTRDVSEQVNEDPRKSIPKSETFEEYMRRRPQAMGQYGKMTEKIWLLWTSIPVNLSSYKRIKS